MEQKKSVAEVLKTEFSEDFVQKMKNRMVTSHYKYGFVKESLETGKTKAIESAMKRIAMYVETGNTEWLVDAGNLLMMEFMYPQHKNAHFRATTAEESPGMITETGTVRHSQET